MPRVRSSRAECGRDVAPHASVRVVAALALGRPVPERNHDAGADDVRFAVKWPCSGLPPLVGRASKVPLIESPENRASVRVTTSFLSVGLWWGSDSCTNPLSVIDTIFTLYLGPDPAKVTVPVRPPPVSWR